MSTVRDDEGLHEDDSDKNASHGNESRGDRTHPIFMDVTPLDPVRDNEGLNEDGSDKNGSLGNESRGDRTPPIYMDLTPLDPVYSSFYEQLQEDNNEYEDIEQQQPEEYNQSEAIESDILDQTEEVPNEADNIFSIPSDVGARISITDDLTSTPKKDNNDEER